MVSDLTSVFERLVEVPWSSSPDASAYNGSGVSMAERQDWLEIYYNASQKPSDAVMAVCIIVKLHQH